MKTQNANLQLFKKMGDEQSFEDSKSQHGKPEHQQSKSKYPVNVILQRQPLIQLIQGDVLLHQIKGIADNDRRQYPKNVGNNHKQHPQQ